jgi:hypothetical protein
MSRDGAVVEAAEDDDEDVEDWHRDGTRSVVVRHLNARRFAFVGMERSMFVYCRLGGAGNIGTEARGFVSLLSRCFGYCSTG